MYSPKTARRLKLETRIFHGGYDMNHFKPEIKRKIRSVDPKTIGMILNRVLIEKNSDQSGEVIDRNLSDSDYYTRLKEKHTKPSCLK